MHPCQNSSPSYPYFVKVSRIRVLVQEIASALPCLAKTEGDVIASPDLSGRGNLIGHTLNTIVVRPFKVVQLPPPRTRLEPRTTFVSLMVCRCGLSFRGLSLVTLSPCLCHSERSEEPRRLFTSRSFHKPKPKCSVQNDRHAGDAEHWLDCPGRVV